MSDQPQPSQLRPMRVVCPGCGGTSLYASSNPFRPFCNERCKNLDLGAWASEHFRMPQASAPEDQHPDQPQN